MIKMRFMDGKARKLNSLVRNQDAGVQIARGLFGDILTWHSLRTFKSRMLQSELCPSKQFVQLCGRRVTGQTVECVVCFDFLRCPNESAPGCESETRTDGDAAYTQIGESRQ